MQQQIGRRGEALAADFLTRHDYVIIARNLRARLYEIDILARKGDTLHLVEVKTSLTQQIGFEPTDRITWRKRRALAKAMHQLSARYPSLNIQVDAIAVYLQQRQITYYPHILE